jgi:hypothetical protein
MGFNAYWDEKDILGSDRDQVHVTSQYFPEETEEDYEESVKKARLWAEIWSRDLPNTKDECWLVELDPRL